jgi:uncharacterized protein YecE (DUF72 family)
MHIYIGCAGWSIPSALRDTFAPQGSGLARYSSVFSAVEINSSFYRPHRPATYARWRDSVPNGFHFSVKVPKTITHELRLRNVSDLLTGFLNEAGNLGEKLGCLLVQLPPSLMFDAAAATRFFSELRSATPAAVACEARHSTWFGPQADDVLARLGIARVRADPAVAGSMQAEYRGPIEYFRLHGSPVMYRSSYSEDFLNKLFADLSRYRSEGKTVWCVFDNTADGAALPNALSLMSRFDPPNKKGAQSCAPFEVEP